jgi:hypothetical protein
MALAQALERDPKKRKPIFGKDHAQSRVTPDPI